MCEGIDDKRNETSLVTRWPKGAPLFTQVAGQMAPRWPKIVHVRRAWAQDGAREPGRSPRWGQDGPKMGPRWAQDGPKMAQGAPNRPKMGPRWAQEGPKMGPRWVPNRSYGALEDGSRKKATLPQRAPPILSHFGVLLGPSWGLLGASWGHLRAYLRHLKIKSAKCQK